MSDSSLFHSAAFIIVEIGLIIVTLIGEFDLFLELLHRPIVHTNKDRFVLPQLLMNCGLEISFGQRKKVSEQQYKLNVQWVSATNRSTILREENIMTDHFLLPLRKKTKLDHRDVLPPKMTDMIEQRIQGEEVQGIAQDGW